MTEMRIEIVYLNTGYTCDMDCIFCVTEGQKGAKKWGEFSTQELIERIDEQKADLIIFDGGEPAIREDIAHLIKYASDKGAATELKTNGTRFADPEFARAIIDAGLDMVSIPLYSHDYQHHDHMTQRKGSFFKTVEGIKNIFALKKEGYAIEIELKTCVCKLNYQQLPEIIRFISTEFPRPQRVTIEVVAMMGNAARNRKELFVPLPSVVPYAKQAIDIGRSYNQNMNIKNVPACIINDPEYSSACAEMRGTMTLFNIEKDKPRKVTVSLSEELPSTCEPCAMRDGCSGVWAAYGNETQFRELRPITGIPEKERKEKKEKKEKEHHDKSKIIF